MNSSIYSGNIGILMKPTFPFDVHYVGSHSTLYVSTFLLCQPAYWLKANRIHTSTKFNHVEAYEKEKKRDFLQVL